VIAKRRLSERQDAVVVVVAFVYNCLTIIILFTIEHLTINTKVSIPDVRYYQFYSADYSDLGYETHRRVF